MKLILQIAGGILLAVAIVGLAVAGYFEVQKTEAQQQSDDATRAVFNLTPAVVISRCGKPTADMTPPTIAGIAPRRVLSYFDPKFQTVELEFMPTGNGTYAVGFALDQYTSRRAMTGPLEEIAELPCLASASR